MGKAVKKVPFLSDLGRANMRGLRKCKKCGTLNGTRGFTCKNTTCDVRFKEDMPNRKTTGDASKLDSGSCRQLYSVRIRDKGPDYRGFVELQNELDEDPLLPQEVSNEIYLMDSDKTKCYVEMCCKSSKMDVSVGVKPACRHIWSVRQCYKEAKTLVLRNTSTHSIQIPSAMKNELWQLATESPGPLVQRVSKSVMVVKCKTDMCHPLGFLHLSFHQYRSKNHHVPKFFCGCRSFKEGVSSKFSMMKNCIHFYACIMAFASNEALAEEFWYFINLVKILNNHSASPEKPNISLVRTLTLDDECKANVSEVHLNAGDESSFLILNNNRPGTPCQVEVEVLGDISDETLTIPIDAVNNDDVENKLEIQLQAGDDGLQLASTEIASVSSLHQLSNSINLPSLKLKSNDIIAKEHMNQFRSKRLLKQKEARRSAVTSNKRPRDEVEEELVTFKFTTWLDSVAERINQAMQYGFSGNPTLVFHIPKSFFNCLLDRINKHAGGRRKKCAVEKSSFVIADAVPCGTFTKMTWKISNVAQVINIFSSNDNLLKTTRYFVIDKTGKYKSFEPPITPKLPASVNQGPPVKPHELKTVLNVGNVSPASKDPVPFVIEWIADIIPLCQIGELRLKFDFIHCNNNHLVKPTVPMSVKHNRQILPLAPKIPANKLALPVNTATTAEVMGLQTSHDFVPGDIAILTF